MIVFNLECKVCSINFEGWFESSSEFEKQKKLKIINCPSCNSDSIKKTLVAPNVSKKSYTLFENNNTNFNDVPNLSQVLPTGDSNVNFNLNTVSKPPAP